MFDQDVAGARGQPSLIGSLDHPEAVTPEKQFGVESRLPAFFLLHDLPGMRTEDFFPSEKMAELASRQHPDRD